MLRIDVITIFPGLVSALTGESIVRNALGAGLVPLELDS